MTNGQKGFVCRRLESSPKSPKTNGSMNRIVECRIKERLESMGAEVTIILADDTSNESILFSILCLSFCDGYNIWKVSYQIIIFTAKVIRFRDEVGLFFQDCDDIFRGPSPFNKLRVPWYSLQENPLFQLRNVN
ncbi:hypothetical protein CEXT_283561 [Caerostris extrusa]|uniref:Glycosyltransferase n=1 Tax=Caerostris extrusa TaxID=172846 RepID=A0AAV4WSQ1_CAEEX|nr:hypothetical protein CEXT_283561 [Caerostris extrusa]